MRFVPACLILILLTAASADRVQAQVPSKGQAAVILGGLLAVGAGVGIGTAYLISHNRGVSTGCVSDSAGRKLFTTDTKQAYALVEQGQLLTVGERFKLKGHKSGPASAPVFTVSRMLKHYGPCH